LEPVFESEQPIRNTGGMPTWYTGKLCEPTKRSHISHCVYDSTWEASESFELDHNELVNAWVKNDHLGFEIVYVYSGIVRKFRPDFLIRLANGTILVLEVKGEDTQQNKTKRRFLDEWVDAVNQHGGFGQWVADVSFSTSDIADILDKHCQIAVESVTSS
jgi:type III restriction enzyme